MRGVTALVAGLVLLLPLSFLAAGTAEEATDPLLEVDDGPTLAASVGTTTSHLQWSSTHSGDFAVRLVLQFAAPQNCLFYFRTGGYVNDNSVLSFHAHDEPGRGWTGVSNGMSIGAHASNIRVAFGGLPPGGYATEAWHGFQGIGEEHWMYAGFDLNAFNHPITQGKSVVFDFQCTGPFTITAIEGGKSLLGFTPVSLRSGLGARAGPITVNVMDEVRANFGEPHIAFRYRSDSAFASGQLSASGPSQSGFWTDDGDLDARLDGGGGLYTVRLTRVANEGPWDAMGVVAGLQSVNSLDAAAAL